jgi:DNA invertase Pin-like site-specific DNA recombinase
MSDKTVALYLRVSTGEQTVENQRRELTAAAGLADRR